MSNVLVVFTAKGVDQILEEGGSSSWALSTKTMRECQYVICTRNTDPEKVGAFGDRNPVAHGAAFLVGKFAGLEFMEVRNGRKRYRAAFSAFAEVNIEEFWDGSRIPTRYLSIDEVNDRGLDIQGLNFEPMQPRTNPIQTGHAVSPSRQTEATTPGELTVAEAKAGLAAKFGIDVEQIEIVIRT